MNIAKRSAVKSTTHSFLTISLFALFHLIRPKWHWMVHKCSKLSFKIRKHIKNNVHPQKLISNLGQYLSILMSMRNRRNGRRAVAQACSKPLCYPHFVHICGKPCFLAYLILLNFVSMPFPLGPFLQYCYDNCRFLPVDYPLWLCEYI
jgi:hypothetical protein